MNNFQEFAERFARKAGAIARDNFTLGMARQWKSDSTPVTETDLKVNTLLIKEVKELFPGHSVKGEEESNMLAGAEYVWVCDPIDGTIPFSHGIPTFTFSLALTHNGESILGVVYDPIGDRLFSAAKGEGAYLNGKKITVSQDESVKGVVGAFEMFDRAIYDIFPLVQQLLVEGSQMMALCSIIYPSMLLAAGEVGFTIFPHNTAHDAAAVKIIVEEAGGKVTDIFGEEQRYDQDVKGFIASNGKLHEKLVEMSKQLVIKK